MQRFDFYKVERNDNLASSDFWNDRLKDIDMRLAQRENDATAIDAAVDSLESLALQRITDTFIPLVQEAEAALNNYGVSFTGASTTSRNIETGQMTFTLTSETKDAYYYTDYVAIRPVADETKSMVAQVLSYVRSTGVLTVDSQLVDGSGTYSNWTIHTSVKPDTAHAGRTDNPHQTTAAQVGAYTTAQADAAIATALAAQGTALAKAENLNDLPDKGAARSNLGLGDLATANSVGSGQISSSVFATPAQIRSATAEKVVQADDLFAAAGYVAMTDATTIAWSANDGFNFSVTIAASRTLGFPSSPKVGQSGFIDVTQPAGGGCTLSYAANITFDQGVAPSLDTGANRVTSLFYHIKSASEMRVAIAFKGVRSS